MRPCAAPVGDGLVNTLTQHHVTTTFGYDSSGNVTSTSDTIGRTSAMVRNSAGDVTSYNDGTTTVSYEYDASDRVTAIHDAAANTTTIGYNDSGCGCSQDDLVTSVHTPDLSAGSKWLFDYNADSMLSAVTDPTGHADAYTYTPARDLDTATDRKGRTTYFTYDQLGRSSMVVDPAGRVGTYAYPIPTGGAWNGPALYAGSPDSTPPPTTLGAALRDGEYQIGLNAIRPGGFPAQIELYRDATFALSIGRDFDEFQRLTRRHDRSDLSFTSTQPYNASNALPPFDEKFSYNLDTPAPVMNAAEHDYTSLGYYENAVFSQNTDFDATHDTGWGAQYDAVDRSITRDTAGRVTAVHSQFRSTRGSVYNTTFDESVTWDPANHRQVKQLVGGSGTQDITYDARGLVASVALTYPVLHLGTGVLETTTETFSFDGYDAVGRNTHLTYPDGHTRTQTWDTLGRLTSRCYDYGSAAPRRCYTSAYDETGSPIVLTDPERSCTIGYDALDRITSVTCSDGDTETYAYNALGALTTNADTVLDTMRPRLDGGGVASSGLPATYAGNPVTLDAVGRVTHLGTATLEWNGRGRLSRITDGTSDEQYGHDSYLRRVARTYTLSGNTYYDYYVYDAPPQASALNAYGILPDTGNITAIVGAKLTGNPISPNVHLRILYEGPDQPLWIYEPLMNPSQNFTAYYELDTLGNVRRLRGGRWFDELATLPSDLGGYKYTAFGKLLPPDAGTPAPTLHDGTSSLPFDQPLRWQSRWYSPLGGGVYDVRARQWSPELGAFLTPDELGFVGRRGTLWSWPGQNPVRRRDPTGRLGYFETFGADFGFAGASSGIFINLDLSTGQLSFGLVGSQDFAGFIGGYAGLGATFGLIGDINKFKGPAKGVKVETPVGGISGTPGGVGVSLGPGEGAGAGLMSQDTTLLGFRFDPKSGKAYCGVL